MVISTDKLFWRMAIILGGIYVLWACSNDNSSEEEQSALSKIEVSSPFGQILLGSTLTTLQFTAEGFDQNNETVGVNEIVWSSSDETKATVDSNGLVTFVGSGQITITATSGSVSGSKDITVLPAASLSKIEVSSSISQAVLGVTEEFKLVAMAFDQNGNAFENTEYTWSSSDDMVASIDENGLVTILDTGDVTFTASSNEVSGETSFSVLEGFEAGSTIFENVNIVDVCSGAIISSQDVFVVNEKIESISATGTNEFPVDAMVIDGTGKYVMPGLGDAHAHVFFESDFYQYLANSVTSVVDMGNSAAATPAESPALDWKNSILLGSLDGPNFYPSIMVRGPEDGGRVANNAAEARQIVYEWREYDFIKAYSRVPASAFDALLSEGENYGLEVIGHANVNLGMTSVLQKGQRMIAHAEEYLYAHFQGNTSQELIDEAISNTLDAQAFVTGTLSTYEAISKIWGANQSGYDELKMRPGYEYTNPTYKNIWDGQFNGSYNQPGSLDGGLTFQKNYVPKFHNAGIKLLLGTDSPLIIGLPAGYSIHEEIRLLKEIGISNADILRIGTLNFAEFIKRDSRNSEDFGEIKPGYRADLVLLDANPINDLETLRSPNMIMVRGKIYTRDFLQQQLDNLANKGSMSVYKPSLLDIHSH